MYILVKLCIILKINVFICERKICTAADHEFESGGLYVDVTVISKAEGC